MNPTLRALAAAPFALAALALAPRAAAAQDVASFCANLPQAQRDECAAVAQTAESAQPQLGILLAGGNPVLGTASTSGLRLGVLPRVSLGVRVNAVDGRIPDIIDGDGTEEKSVPVAAVGANVSVGLFNGVSLAPTVGGFGAVDLLGSVTLIPLGAIDVDGFDSESVISWGAGARVSLLRESFATPGVSVSVMYRKMDDITVGEVCPGSDPSVEGPAACVGGGDFGEASFGMTNWSVRGAVGKRFLGLGATAGIGWDRFESDADIAFQTSTTPRTFVRENDLEVSNDRVSLFANLSYTFLVGSIILEGGWMSGGDAVNGYAASDFDPEQGNLFGSLGFRLQL